MPTLTAITAVLAGKHEFLGETAKSLEAQVLPAGWQLEWLVQEDGETGLLDRELEPAPWISPGSGPHGRAAAARTIALGRATGDLVKTVDADDVIPAGAFARDIEVLTSHPELGWCVSAALDLLPDGTLQPGPRDPDPGPLPPGFFYDGVASGLLQVVCTTMCIRTDLLFELGGWPAMPVEEDIALLLAAEAVAPGWMVEGAGLHYRRWPGSTTAGIDKSGVHFGDARLETFMLRRAAALRAGRR